MPSFLGTYCLILCHFSLTFPNSYCFLIFLPYSVLSGFSTSANMYPIVYFLPIKIIFYLFKTLFHAKSIGLCVRLLQSTCMYGFNLLIMFYARASSLLQSTCMYGFNRQNCTKQTRNLYSIHHTEVVTQTISSLVTSNDDPEIRLNLCLLRANTPVKICLLLVRTGRRCTCNHIYYPHFNFEVLNATSA